VRRRRDGCPLAKKCLPAKGDYGFSYMVFIIFSRRKEFLHYGLVPQLFFSYHHELTGERVSVSVLFERFFLVLGS
jgi:hypothetical protein